MKTLLLSFLLLCSLTTFAQTSPNVHAKTVSASETEQDLIKNSTVTNLVFEGLKVYKTSKGSYFVAKKSSKTSKYYRKYVTVDEK